MRTNKSCARGGRASPLAPIQICPSRPIPPLIYLIYRGRDPSLRQAQGRDFACRLSPQHAQERRVLRPPRLPLRSRPQSGSMSRSFICHSRCRISWGVRSTFSRPHAPHFQLNQQLLWGATRTPNGWRQRLQWCCCGLGPHTNVQGQG